MINIIEFRTYLNDITESLSLNQAEKEDLKEEWYQHLIELMNDFLQKGFSQNEAVELAMKQFGEALDIRSQLQKSFFPSWKIHLFKEMMVWMICLVAASVGPVLLINAQYQLFFIIGPLILLVLCCGIYHYFIKRLSFPLIWLGMLPILYVCFVYFITRRASFDYFLNQLVTLDLKGDGIFTISVIHLLWIGIIIRSYALQASSHKRWLGMVRSSFEYWAMLMISLFIVHSEILTNSGEGKVIILNIFLLYVFLQKMIEPSSFIKSKNKLKYWLN